MRRVYLLFLLFPFSLFSQSQYAKEMLDTLSSDAFFGRGYVRSGDSLAAVFLSSEYSKNGAKPFKGNFLQAFSFPVNTFPDTFQVVVNGKELMAGKDVIIHPASGSVKGRFVLSRCNRYNLKERMMAFAGRKDVLLVIDPDSLKGDDLKGMRNLAELAGREHPIIWLNSSKLTWSVSREVKFTSFLEINSEVLQGVDTGFVDLHIDQKFIPHHTANNVVGMIKGKNKKKKWMVIIAHYDHLGMMGTDAIFKGANDNASGVSMLLDLMRYYSEHQPEQNIVFMCFAGEEAGIIGSRYFTEHPLFKLKKIDFLLNLDLLGSGEEGITVVNATLYPEAFSLLEKINSEKQLLTQIKKRGEAANSDHYWFTKKGVPAFFIYTMGGSKAYHDIYDQSDQLSLAKYDEVEELIKEFISLRAQ